MITELAAARLQLAKTRPYLTVAVFALQPVETPGLGTMAVDEKWRLYYDPAIATVWTVSQISAVLYHEILHLLRSHAERRICDPAAWNIAADAEINDDLIAEDVALPQGAVTPSGIGMPDGLTAEEYAVRMQSGRAEVGLSAQSQNSDDAPEMSDQAHQGGDGCPQDNATGESCEEGKASSGYAPDKPESGDGPATCPNSPDAGSADSQDSADSGVVCRTSTGEACGSTPQAASMTHPHARSQSAGTRVQSGTDACSHDMPGTPIPPVRPAPAAGRCGSCATGVPESWEKSDDNSGLTKAQAAQALRVTAQEIARNISDVPGHLRRFAEERLAPPRVDWRRELASAVRAAISSKAGACDYSYSRPNRRQGRVGNGSIVFPALRQPTPTVAVVVDTSGSIRDSELQMSLRQIEEIIRNTGNDVTVLAVDTEVTSKKRVANTRKLDLVGGGGTDMRVGIDAALKSKPTPDVVVVLTDGYTPWPNHAPRKTKVIAALLDETAQTPDWARRIICTRNS